MWTARPPSWPRPQCQAANGYGSFDIDTAGAWTYTLASAHDEFVAGTTYTDSLTVATADGTQQTLTVTITGTNDAAVITGSSSASLTETDAVQTTSGSLSATDVDSSAAFVAQTEHRRRQRLRQLRHRHRRRLDLHPGQCP